MCFIKRKLSCCITFVETHSLNTLVLDFIQTKINGFFICGLRFLCLNIVFNLEFRTCFISIFTNFFYQTIWVFWDNFQSSIPQVEYHSLVFIPTDYFFQCVLEFYKHTSIGIVFIRRWMYLK